jgi:excisionase family DNA binding protein
MADFIDVEQACSILHCTRNYLYQLIHKRAIPCYKPRNGRVLFDREELESYIRKARQATREELEEQAVDLLNSRGR